jgi:YesN/AraC family two-component response regulator
MEKQELYLNPELRLSDVAEALDIRPYRVSEILSRGLQTTFYDLVNRYRVSKAQKLLLSRILLISIYLGLRWRVGSSLNRSLTTCFKKATGMTPSQYRNANRTESAHSDA